MMKKSKSLRYPKVIMEKEDESLCFIEAQSNSEDLGTQEGITECISEKGFDDENVIDRVKLF